MQVGNSLYRNPSLPEPPISTTTLETVTVSPKIESFIDDYGKGSDIPKTTASTTTVLVTPSTPPTPPLEEAKQILTFLENKIKFLEEKKR